MKQSIQKLCMYIVVLCTFIPASAYDFEVDGIAYTITSFTDLTVGVAQLVKNDVSEITIPETVEYRNISLKVTSIMNEAFINNSKLTKVSLPNTIISIGKEAFRENTSLSEINLPEHLTRIGSGAFSGCTSIFELTIPYGVEDIGDEAFYDCKYLARLTCYSGNLKSIGKRAFQNSGIISFSFTGNLSLGAYAFADTPLNNIFITGIEIIPEGCFSNCTELFTVEFEKYGYQQPLKKIEAHAFDGCKRLQELSIPSEVDSIEPSILWNCPNLSKLTIGKNLNGLPFQANFEPNWGQTICTYLSLGGYCYINDHSVDTRTCETHLQGVKEFIIEDPDKDFSIKGFYIDTNTIIPPFTNTELDYYYVGRH